MEDFRLEAYLDGILLVFHHRDVPGIIGYVGSVFGKYDVNIAQMAVGRAKPGSEAVGILNLDNMPPQEALDELAGHAEIVRVQTVQLPPAGQLPSWL